MSTTWINCRPESDEEAWTMPPSDERRQLLEDIAGQLDDHKVRPEFWAFLQVGDLAKIRNLSLVPTPWRFFQSSDSAERARLRDTLQLWLQRREIVYEGTDTNTNTPSNHKRTHSTAFSPNDSPTPRTSSLQTPTSRIRTRSGRASGTPEGSVRRDVRIVEQSKQRDGNLCIITKMSAIEACHIYPWCAFRKNTRVDNFWATLSYFWPDEKVNSWRRKIFPADDRGKETVKNIVTFTVTVYKFYSDGAFALRPVQKSADNTKLELEFHWLKRQARENKNTDTVDIMDPPLSSRDLKSSGLGEFFFRWDGDQSATQLYSGYRFTIETDDCENRPLPDTDLLELQWQLQRIFAMSGAAGWKEDDDDDADDDNVDPQRVLFSASASDDDVDHRRSSSSSSGSDDDGEGWYS